MAIFLVHHRHFRSWSFGVIFPRVILPCVILPLLAAVFCFNTIFMPQSLLNDYVLDFLLDLVPDARSSALSCSLSMHTSDTVPDAPPPCLVGACLQLVINQQESSALYAHENV